MTVTYVHILGIAVSQPPLASKDNMMAPLCFAAVCTYRLSHVVSVRTCVSVFRIHKHADSLFSTSSGFSDFRGFFNLAVLLLVLSSARVALENIIK